LQLDGVVRGHPVARIDVLGRDGGGQKVPQMAPKRANTEPNDTTRLL
jgi:hypothetical protein